MLLALCLALIVKGASDHCVVGLRAGDRAILCLHVILRCVVQDCPDAILFQQREARLDLFLILSCKPHKDDTLNLCRHDCFWGP